MMQYKGYSADVTFDDENNIFHGEVLDIRDVVTFQGATVTELRKAFRESVDDYLQFCRERGEQPSKPYSGRFVVRMPPRLHRDLDVIAKTSGRSLNSWVVMQLQEAAGAGGPIGRAASVARAKRTSVAHGKAGNKRRRRNLTGR
jgi:predicted HicB family RNase H-like nuclease